MGRQGRVSNGASIGIGYLDGPRLRVSLLAAADWVDAGREELDRINVFPVPDGDTGTNFASTFRAVAEAVRKLGPAPLPDITQTMAKACVFSAHGNSGMLLSQFLLGFRETLGGKESASPHDVACAIRQGADRLHRSLESPVEGTILTVAREAADEAERAAQDSDSFEDLMHRVLTHAEATLERTPELLAVLKEAGVVDAGAKAFVRMLEGVVRLIQGDPILPASTPVPYSEPDAAALTEVITEHDFRFCTEVLVSGEGFPSNIDIQAQLRELGGSIVVLEAENLLKIHIHTEDPDSVCALASKWGQVESTKADDMREQHRELHSGSRPISLVVDSSCDLPDEEIDRHNILVVPLQVVGDGRTFLDKVEISGPSLYEKMSRSSAPFTTSQPTPGAFARAFHEARGISDNVLGLFIASALSGTVASASVAAEAAEIDGITIVDSRSASLGLGLLALRAAELAAEGWSVSRIETEVQRIRDQSGGLFTVDRFDNLLRSGRVSRGRAWLGGLLDIKPILEVNNEGRVVPIDRVRGREALLPRVLEHLDERIGPKPRRLRMGIVHAAAPETGEELRAELIAHFSPMTCYVEDVASVIGVHVGPGAWGIFYQIED